MDYTPPTFAYYIGRPDNAEPTKGDWFYWGPMVYSGKAAEVLRITRPTVAAWARLGYIRYRYVPGVFDLRWFFHGDDIKELMTLLAPYPYPSVRVLRNLTEPRYDGKSDDPERSGVTQ
jgi:hypothetical protein